MNILTGNVTIKRIWELLKKTVTSSDLANYSVAIDSQNDKDTKRIPLDELRIALMNSGLYDYRGEYDASVNLYPSSGGSGTGGLILMANIWIASVGGTIDGITVIPGQTLMAKIDNPGQNSANWAISLAGSSFDLPGTIHSATAETEILNADEIPFWKAVGGVLRKITFANLKATLKTYFDGIYPTVSHIHTDIYKIKYGYLYNWHSLANLAAAGATVPTYTELLDLMNYLGGNSVAGGKLKETGLLHWLTPNTGATNEVNFNLRPGGQRSYTDGTFSELTTKAYLWTITQYSSIDQKYRFIASYNNDDITTSAYPRALGHSVRLRKTTAAIIEGQSGIYTGNDGKVYPTTCINGVEWLACNLAETLYNDGSPIPNVTDDAAWAALTTGARCAYGNDESNVLYRFDIANEINVSSNKPVPDDADKIGFWDSITGLLKHITWANLKSIFITDAPSDGLVYGRKDAAWTVAGMSGGMKSFFFTKTASDVSGMYQALTDVPTTSTQEITGVAVDGETILASFITNIATSPYTVIDGSRFFHILARTSSIVKATQLKGYIYQTDIDGANPVLLRTSTLSTILTEVDSEYVMSVWGGSLTIPVTMRIQFVISVVKTGTGVDPTITLSVDDDTFSRLDVPSIFNGNIYAELAGAIFAGEVKFLKTVEQPAYSNTFSASKTIDFSLGNVQYMSITGDVSITLSNLREGVNMLILTNDATVGRAVTSDSTFGTKTDNSATHSTAANKVNIYTIMKYGSVIKYTIETSN
jgi:uncharacterized protein (TIGR02145 family)